MLDLLFGPPARRASTYENVEVHWPYTGLSGRSKTTAGVSVNQQTALTYAAVWCATRVLCEPAGAMPLVTYKRISSDDREPAPEYSLYPITKTSPNDDMAAQPFWEGRFQHAINWDGGGFAEIERETTNPESPVVALHPIHPCRVTRPTKEQKDRGIYYNVRNDNGPPTEMRRDQIFHMPGVLSEDGIWSRGVIPYARQTIGFGLATEQYGATYFGSGGQPRVLVTGFQPYNNPEARKTFRTEWKEAHGGPASDDVGLAPPGTDIKLMSIANEAAQFLETRVHTARVIAQWYMVPLHRIMDMERATQASLEQVSLEFVIYHLWPWLMRCQGQCNLKLIPRRDQAKYYVEHNLDSLLRGDLKSRMDAYRIAIGIGVRTINECRKLENLPSIGPAGDVHYVPANMTTAEVMMTSPPTAGTVGPGSDHSGQPGEAPPGQLKALTHSDRDEIEQNIKAMAKDIEHGVPSNRTESGNGHAGVKSAARPILVEAFGRWFTKETNATIRGFERKGEFFKFNQRATFQDWANDFYSKHQATLTEALQPATGLLNAIGITVTAAEIAGKTIADSKAIISNALSEGPSKLTAVLESWPTQRAELAADQILGAS